MHVPSAQPLGILHDQLEALEIKRSDSVEADVEEDQRPFEECIDRVS
jgi:hypothetical protein